MCDVHRDDFCMVNAPTSDQKDMEDLKEIKSMYSGIGNVPEIKDLEITK